MFEGWDRKRILPFGPSAPLHPSHTLRCGSLPLTAAGGQGPQGNTAYDPVHIHFNSYTPVDKSVLRLKSSTKTGPKRG